MLWSFNRWTPLCCFIQLQGQGLLYVRELLVVHLKERTSLTSFLFCKDRYLFEIHTHRHTQKQRHTCTNTLPLILTHKHIVTCWQLEHCPTTAVPQIWLIILCLSWLLVTLQWRFIAVINGACPTATLKTIYSELWSNHEIVKISLIWHQAKANDFFFLTMWSIFWENPDFHNILYVDV